MPDAAEVLAQARRTGNPGTLVQVAEITGFGLRDETEFAVVVDGEIHGSVLAGLANDQILSQPDLPSIANAPDTSFRVRVTDAQADAGGLICGGTATLSARSIAALDQATVDALSPITKIMIAGSGPMVAAITAQGQLLDWQVAASEDLDDLCAFIAEAGRADGVVILSHDRSLDVPVLDAALGSNIGYIGAMGSRRTQQARASKLADLGWDETDRARIFGPVGLDLGSRTPADTALAIAAEFVANRNGRSPGSLAATTGPIHG